MKDMEKNKELYQQMLKNNNIDIDTLLEQKPENFISNLCNKIRKSNIKTYGSLDQNRRIENRIKDIKFLIGDKIDENFKYIDIGCNDGSLTNGIAEYFNFKKENVYGVDVEYWSNVRNDCNVDHMFYINEDNPVLPYEDNYFDLITSFQVLHHNKNVKKMVKEIRRILKPGGYLVIREHDLRFNLTKELIDFEHIKYMCVEMNDWSFNNYIGDYKSLKEWNNLFNLKLVRYIKPRGLLRVYTNAYTKIN